MSVPICACGHPWASHATRRYGPDAAKMLSQRGASMCPVCECPAYTDAVNADSRVVFRVRPKRQVGNFGSGHPLMVALDKSDPSEIYWLPISCAGCSLALEPKTAIVLDSSFYCGSCFINRPEVFCG